MRLWPQPHWRPRLQRQPRPHHHHSPPPPSLARARARGPPSRSSARVWQPLPRLQGARWTGERHRQPPPGRPGRRVCPVHRPTRRWWTQTRAETAASALPLRPGRQRARRTTVVARGMKTPPRRLRWLPTAANVRSRSQTLYHPAWPSRGRWVVGVEGVEVAAAEAPRGQRPQSRQTRRRCRWTWLRWMDASLGRAEGEGETPSRKMARETRATVFFFFFFSFFFSFLFFSFFLLFFSFFFLASTCRLFVYSSRLQSFPHTLYTKTVLLSWSPSTNANASSTLVGTKSNPAVFTHASSPSIRVDRSLKTDSSPTTNSV